MLYKQSQKLKRAKAAVVPLLSAVKDEINYLEQVEDTLLQTPTYDVPADLRSLEETCRELIDQGYLRDATGYQSGQKTRQKKGQKTGKKSSKHQAQEAVGFPSIMLYLKA